MAEIVVIIWTVLAAAFGFSLIFIMKKKEKTLGKHMMIFMLILVAIVFLTSMLVYWLGYPSMKLVWIDRLVFLSLGTLTTWALYFRPWTQRDPLDYNNDSMLPEMLLMAASGCICAVAYVAAPQVIQVVPYSVELSTNLWDMPILFFLPIATLKLLDMCGQVPFKSFENPFLFTIEEENVKNWPRRDLTQIHFEIKTSLLDEYDLFTWPTKPWIEAPKEVSLGRIYRLMIQQRRLRTELATIQDMGDEYGTSTFWWSFKIKFIWFKPNTWRRKNRHLNPDLSLTQNGVLNGDVIVARRIPGSGKKIEIDYTNFEDDDFSKTVIISR